MFTTIGNQFKQPRGFLGKIVSAVMKQGNRPDYDKLIPELRIQPGDKIFEIGYGHGKGVHRLCSGFDCHVSGIDFSKLMYREAQKRNRKYIAEGKVELLYGNINDTTLPESRYDKAFCIHVVYFWDQLRQPFEKVHSLLKEGGTYYIVMAHPDFIRKMKFTKDGIFNKYTVEQISEELGNAGFTGISHITTFKGYIIKAHKPGTKHPATQSDF